MYGWAGTRFYSVLLYSEANIYSHALRLELDIIWCLLKNNALVSRIGCKGVKWDQKICVHIDKDQKLIKLETIKVIKLKQSNQHPVYETLILLRMWDINHVKWSVMFVLLKWPKTILKFCLFQKNMFEYCQDYDGYHSTRQVESIRNDCKSLSNTWRQIYSSEKYFLKLCFSSWEPIITMGLDKIIHAVLSTVWGNCWNLESECFPIEKQKSHILV